MSKAKRIMALVLTAVMAISVAACGSKTETQQSSKSTETKQEASTGSAEAASTEEAVSDYPEYLNTESAYPIIKDEYAGTITLKVAYVQPANGGEWEDLWLCQYLREKYNVEFEVQSVAQDAQSTQLNLLLNSGDLPDIFLNFSLGASDIVQYGVQEQLFLQCDQYISKEYTPGLYKYLYEEREDARLVATAPDGHIYTLPYLQEVDDEGSQPRNFINNAWLQELGLEMPETLDEFIDALYKMKEADLAGVGSENVYPLGGGINTYGEGWYILEALGYLTTDSYGSTVCIRDGEVVFPAYDTEVFVEYLKIMKQFYDDGIINPDYFTIDSATSQAQLLAGQTGVFSQPVYTVGVANFDDWEACIPLTSEWNAEPGRKRTAAASLSGALTISADTEYPELCMRIMDIFYNNITDDPYALWVGPADEQWNLGYVHHLYSEETNWYCGNPDLPEGMDHATNSYENRVGCHPSWGAVMLRESNRVNIKGRGYEPADYMDTLNPENGDANYRLSVIANVMPYLEDGYPSTIYVDVDTNQIRSDLATVIIPYIQEQVALFISGNRDISEIDAFAQELKAMGIEDLLDIYQQAYDSYISNK